VSQQTTNRSFDDLARGLADGSITRGKAIRLMGAALVGGALGSLGIGEAGADPIGCKRNGKACKKDTQCCSGNCEGGTCAAACVSDGGACFDNTDCCSDNCDSSGFCFPPTGGTINVSCQCADASGSGHNIDIACLSECPQLNTFFIPVCTSVCANNGFDFVSGGCSYNSPVCPPG
jgi:hypothetical protein